MYSILPTLFLHDHQEYQCKGGVKSAGNYAKGRRCYRQAESTQGHYAEFDISPGQFARTQSAGADTDRGDDEQVSALIFREVQLLGTVRNHVDINEGPDHEKIRRRENCQY